MNPILSAPPCTIQVKSKSDFTQEELASLWMEFKSEGWLRTIFWMGEPTLHEFLGMYGPKNACLLIAKYDHYDVEEIAGLGWINSQRRIGLSAEMSTVEVGIGLLERFHPLRHSIPLGREALRVAFSRDGNILTAVGLTPEKNRGALAFAKRIGMKVLDPIPKYAFWDGEPCGMCISCITREEFYGGR